MTLTPFFHRYPGTPRGRKSSVHCYNIRYVKALEESSKSPADITDVIRYSKEFLSELGIPVPEDPRFAYEKTIYRRLQEEYHLQDVRDIIWMKFTKDGYLGCVATSNDICYDIPPSAEEYHRRKSGRWMYATSGILIHQLHKEWDESFVLIFPLGNMPEGHNRHTIETGIGNYLIEKGVPILDFYSHNY